LGQRFAQIIWLYIAHDYKDIQLANWVCRTCWIDPSLPKEYHPVLILGNDKVDKINIQWNKNYKIHKNVFEQHFGNKNEVIEANQNLLNIMIPLTNQTIELFKKYKEGNLSENELITLIQKMEPNINDAYNKANNIPFPPQDCRDYDQVCQELFLTLHNIFLIYSTKGLEIWSKSNREKLMRLNIKLFKENLEKLKIEERKIN
jgi:hypothetical protein